MLQLQRSILFLGDTFSLILAFVIMIAVRFDANKQWVLVRHQANVFAWLFIVWLIVFFVFDLYNLRRINPNPRNIGLLLSSMFINTFLGIAFFYLFSFSGITPKTNLAIVAILSLILLVLWRRLFYHLFTVRFTRSIATIGTSPLMSELQTELRRNPHFGEHVVHWNTLSDANTAQNIDIIIAEHTDPQRLLTVATTLGAETMTLAESYETFFAKIPLSLITDEKAIDIMTRHENKALSMLYRLVEIVVATTVLTITSPFLLIAIFARLIEDGRPIFFNHTRVGKNGVPFTVYKIRSMIKDSEQSGAQWAEKKDRRVTPVGKVLRASHIDEVPQMINIIKGDIALVGPRPERPEFVQQLEQQIPYYFLRHTIRPGFTGWAQIKYRYARSVDDAGEKFEYDVYYLKNRTTLLDIGIILKTLQIIFTHV